jgi:pimeloyl-ACP methyl ester carboxylesterase
VLRHVTGSEGVRIACEVSGEGPPLVLVHGAGSARWTFDLLRPLLEARFTVVAVDRRGRGESGDGEGYRLQSEFEDVAAVVQAARERGGERILLFGHSYGGLVAAGAAPLAGELGALMLYEPPMGGVLAPLEQEERWRRLTRDGRSERMVEEFLHDVGGYTLAEIDALRETPAWEGRLAVAPTVPRELEAERRHRLDRGAVGRLASPSLLLVGSRSPAWAVRSTDAYAQALDGVSVRRLEGHGHGGLAEAPELIASEIERFLGTGRRRSRA